MDEWRRISIERECERLVTSYCHLVDHGEAAKIADLFTEDGVWTSAEFTANNREEVRAAMTQRQENANRMSRHVCNNLQLDVIDDDHAEGVVYLTLYRNDGKPGRRLSPLEGPVMVGEYRDSFVRGDEGWKISRREIVVSFLRREGEARG